MSQRIDIAMGFDAIYAPHAGAAIASVLRHAPGASFHFTILHAGVDEALRAKVEGVAAGHPCHWIEVRDEDLPALADRGHFNRSILFRLGLEKLAPATLTRVLYLDADVVALGDVRELWRVELGEHPLGAMRDGYVDGSEFAARWGLDATRSRYFNSGVLLIDLERVRAEKLFTAAIDWVIAHDSDDLLFADQDALNHVFWGRWRMMDAAWNVQRYLSQKEIAAEPEERRWRDGVMKLVHFTGEDKPWMANVWHPWSWLYWDAQLRTPFAEDVRRAYKMDAYQLMRLRFRWLLKQPRTQAPMRA